MRRIIVTLTLLIGLLLPMMAEDVVYLTTDQFRQRIFDYKVNKEWKYTGDKPCVIDFYTTWCGPCRRLAPIMEELAIEYAGKVIFYKVDVEKEKEVAQAFGISSFPRILYVPMTDKPMMQIGLQPKENIQEIIDEHLITK